MRQVIPVASINLDDVHQYEELPRESYLNGYNQWVVTDMNAIVTVRDFGEPATIVPFHASRCEAGYLLPAMPWLRHDIKICRPRIRGDQISYQLIQVWRLTLTREPRQN